MLLRTLYASLTVLAALCLAGNGLKLPDSYELDVDGHLSTRTVLKTTSTTASQQGPETVGDVDDVADDDDIDDVDDVDDGQGKSTTDNSE